MTSASPPLERLAPYRRRVDARLETVLGDLTAIDRAPAVDRVMEAMEAALTSPGKRLRPVVTLVVAEIFGRDDEVVLDLGCVVEMVHACSLVLDDLPAMDHATLRRGRPAVHVEFGEDVAVLAAFGLLNRAYGLLAECGTRLGAKRYSSDDLAHHLAGAIGPGGLIGGQALDLATAPADVDLEVLEHIHSHKTGALFIAAAEFGAMVADASRRDLETVTRFAKNLGLAFQITDDLLDVEATSAQTGKESGRDTQAATFVTLLGRRGARQLASELLDFARRSIEPLGRRGALLRTLADVVRERRR